MTEPEIPDLRSLLAEASRPAAEVTVMLKQHLWEAFEEAEGALEDAAANPAKGKRSASKSPLTQAAEKVAAIQAEAEASSLTFRFEALTYAEREQIRTDMGGRDNDDEMNLRALAFMCRSVTGPGGVAYSDRLSWEDFRDLRDRLGAQQFDRVDGAAGRAGGGRWSVPFSSAASHILGIVK